MFSAPRVDGEFVCVEQRIVVLGCLRFGFPVTDSPSAAAEWGGEERTSRVNR